MHGDNINYLVCFGYVDWKRDGDLKSAIYVLMECNNYINYQSPPHILTEKDSSRKSDLDNVIEKIDILRRKYNL